MPNSVMRGSALVAAAALVVAGSSIAASAQTPARSPVVRDLARELGCSPEAAVLPPAPTVRVLGGQQPKRTVFGKPDAVVLSGGAARGLRVGQEYFVRRVVHDAFAMPVSGFVPLSIKTAAWVRIVDVDEDSAVATILDSCDGVLAGDYLEPYVRHVLPASAAPGEPDYSTAGVIVLGDERRLMGAVGSTMVVDRGTSHGVQPGQRATIFRAALEGTGPILRIGEATAVIVRWDTSVIRIDTSRDAVMVGDRIALHK